MENNLRLRYTYLQRHEDSRGVEGSHLSILLVRAPLGQAVPVVLKSVAPRTPAARTVTLGVPEVKVKLPPATFAWTAVVPPAR